MSKMLRLFAAAVLGLPAISHAVEPGDYVREPAVEYGEREIDFKAGSARLKDSQGGGRASAASIGLGWGASERWFTEAYVKYEKNPGERAKYDAFEWENKYQLTEHNQYFVDAALFLEIEVPRNRDEGYEIEFGPLFQFDTGAVRWNVNPVFGKSLRSREEGEHPTELGYQLQARYTLRPNFDVGFQAFGDMGKWDHWEPASEQDHRIGPAVFGKVKLGGREAIVYNAAWLFGASQAAAKNTLRLQAEYEF